MSFRWEGTVTRKGKTHLKFTSTPRCVGCCLQYFKNTNECPPKHNNHFQSTTIFLQNTTITSRAQRRIAIHNSKHNKVSRNTTITTTNKSMNLPPWTPVISKWWRTAYSVDITSNNWHNKTSKFKFLCIVLAITCATLLATSQSQALKSSTQSDWPLIRVKFHGKETVVPRRWWSETRKLDIKRVYKGQISTSRTQRSWRLGLETSASFSFYDGHFTPVIIIDAFVV